MNGIAATERMRIKWGISVRVRELLSRESVSPHDCTELIGQTKLRYSGKAEEAKFVQVECASKDNVCMRR